MPGLGRRLQRDVAQALAIPGQFNEQRRWSACVAIVTFGDAPDQLPPL
jgi:hypothetical protein